MTETPFATPRTPPEEPAPAPTADLGRRAGKGATWTIFGYGASVLIRFASNVILTHIFPPAIMGLMGLVNAFLQGITLFSDVGIRPSIIHNKRGNDPDFLNTAWTIQVMRGSVLWIASIALAWPYGVWLYGEPTLAQILPIAGLSSFIMGFFSSKLASQNRDLTLGRITIIEIVTQICVLTVNVSLALWLRSIWALVIGGLVGMAVKLVLSHAVLPGIRNRLRWDKDSARSLINFGRWIFVNTMLTYLVGQSDKLVLAKLVPMATFGVYGLASTLVQMPTTLFGNLSNNVAFPVYTGVLLKNEPVAPMFQRLRWMMMLAAGYVLAGVIAGGPAIAHILWPAEYWEASWMLQILAVGAVFGTIETVNSHALLAIGQQRWNVVSRVAMIAGMGLMMALGYIYYGFVGAVVGFASAELFRYIVSSFALARYGLSAMLQDVKMIVLVAFAAGLAWEATQLLHAKMYNKFVDAFVVLAIVSVIFAIPGIPMAKRFIAMRRARG